MKTFAILLSLLLVISAVNANGASGEALPSVSNMVPNPGFEVTSDSRPVDWEPFGPKNCCVLTTEQSHGGKGSVVVRGNIHSAALWESRFIRLSGPGGAEFSAWMKLSDVQLGMQQWHKAGIRLTFYSAEKTIISRSDMIRDEGSHGWVQVRKAVTIPVGTSFVKVTCFLSKTSGTVWFDDISLRAYPAHVGWRFSTRGGEKEITISVDPSRPKGDIGNVNGVLYENVKKNFLGVRGLKPTLIRTPQIVTYYHLIQVDGSGRIRYNWTLLDRDIRTIVRMGAVPFVSIGWVPQEFEAEMRHGDYSRWREFVVALVTRYSKMYDISKWYWNFWNEPSGFREIGGKKGYVNWTGTERQFYRFYAVTARAAQEANDKVNIGGAGFAAGSPWLFRFIHWCGVNGVRLNFVSWHSYGVVPELIGEKIRRVRAALKQYRSTSEAGQVIDEWSSYLRGTDMSKSALGNGNYAAAYRVAAIIQMVGSSLSANAWFNTYEDGFGVMAGGVKHASYDSFVLMSRLGRRLVSVDGYQSDPYVSAIAAVNTDGSVGVLVTYFKHWTDRSANQARRVTIAVHGRDGEYTRYRIFKIESERAVRAANERDHGMSYADGVVGPMRDNAVRVHVLLKSNSVLLLKLYRR